MTEIGRPDLEGYVGKNTAGFFVDFRHWRETDLNLVLERLSDMSAVEWNGPCDIVVRLGDGFSRLETEDLETTNADLHRQVSAVLAEQRASFAVSTEVATAPPQPEPVAEARTPAAVGAGYRDASWIAGAIAAERRQTAAILRTLYARVEGFDSYATSVAHEPRRLFAYALAQGVRHAPTVSERIKLHAAAIVELFDPIFYVTTYPDIADELENPLLHYVLVGWRDGLHPNPLFDSAYYVEQAESIQGDPLLHYVTQGASLGFDPHPLFNTEFYRARYLSGETEQINPLMHYLTVGGTMRFDPSPLFDTTRFIASVPFADAINCPLRSFVSIPELRDVGVLPAFDAPLYRYQIEVERGIKLAEPPLTHYLREGFRDETLLPNILFDPRFYRERNGLRFEGPGLLHYLAEGDRLGLACHQVFSSRFYNEQRTDGRDEMTALEHATRFPDAGLRTDPRMEKPLDPAVLGFVKDLIYGTEDFDPAFYRSANPDIAQFNDAEAWEHYDAAGRSEGRLMSARQLMKRVNAQVADVPVGMVAADYAYLSPDLATLAELPIVCLCHYFEHGKRENRPVGLWQLSLSDINLQIPTTERPHRVMTERKLSDVCLLIHMYYGDLWPELAGFARNFDSVTHDIFANVVDIAWTPALHQEIRNFCPGSFVQLSNDDGRDIGGFVRLLDNVDFSRYEIFAFIHSKKSPHIPLERGTYWRRSLMRAFAASPEVVAECVQLFKNDPSVGIIAASEWRCREMGNNQDQYLKLLDLFEVEEANRELDYVSGTMFLIRADIVKRLHAGLREIKWEYGGDNVLDFHVDGQIAHGVERLIPALCRQMGYRVEWR